MNHPDRIAAWLVDTENGQEAMEVQDDTKLEGSIRVLLNAQDHTLGNMLRSQLLLDSNVLFAGYRIPHPLTNQVELRIQTDKAMEPYVSPRKALLNACIALMTQTRDLKASFIEQVRVAEMDTTSGPIASGAGPALTSGLGAAGNGIGAPYDETHVWGGGMGGGNAAGGAIGAYGSGAPGVGRGAATQAGAGHDDAYEY
ncbi:hypothetical protein NliqN6_0833 [Naganishia liquefaciens]|uniref:DNA-directed RNA polymerase RBP11-like dimerisation domain-containing protein n=1 Tax=Naganishia liquefaciens TaxID=104408 RepID=A0A8H3YE54_9TREE|nr:hypothetical protein NliqN6_0833 [Naganishia liquefaciens]